jgi:SAM-dependent methyltransferase
MPDLTARRARVFGEVADEYERFRPGYPAALVDDVLAYANLGGASALEVGAGTGKATVAFVERGVDVTALEPDARMAAVLRGRVGPHVTIAVTPFEEYLPDKAFGLVYSAQAWHWVNPETRWRHAIAALAPGGALALFWNGNRPADPAVVEAMSAAHKAYAPDTEVAIMPDNFGTNDYTELVEHPGFTDLVHRLYKSERRLSAEDYLAYLGTTSGYRVLDDATRTRVFDTIGAALGDEVVLTVRTALALARPKP